MAQSEAALGQSNANLGVSSCADRLATIYRQKERLPETVQAIEIEEDNAECYFLRYCKWAANTPIPFNFKNDLQPANEESKRCLTSPLVLLRSTLVNI